jgi:hypothetical protein
LSECCCLRSEIRTRVAETCPTRVTAQSMLEKPTVQRVAQRRFRSRILRSRPAEVLVLTALVFGVFVWKSTLIAKLIIPNWDPAVYLLNAHDILFGLPMYEWVRPFLLSGIIAGVWSITGESYLFVRYFNLVFTLASAVVLYYLARREIGQPFAFAATLMYVASPGVLYWSDFILVHGLTALFSILTLLALRKLSSARWLLGGAFGALAILSRYTSIIIVLPIVLAYSIDFFVLKASLSISSSESSDSLNVKFQRKYLPLVVALAIGLAIPLFVYHSIFPFVFPRFLLIFVVSGVTANAAFVETGSPLYYLLNWHNFFGIVGFMGLAVLFMPSTFKSLSSRPWVFWLIGSLAFYSALTSNQQGRFTYEWTPAVAYLTMLGFRKIYDTTSLGLSTIHLPSVLSSVRVRRLLVGTALAVLIFLQVFASVGAYLQEYPKYAPYFGDPAFLTVVQYMRQHTGPNATFISDYRGPELAYLSGRCGGSAYTVNTKDPGFLDHLHKEMINGNVDYLIIFPKQTGKTPSMFMQSGFLQLDGTLQTTLGQVFIFHRMEEIVEHTTSLPPCCQYGHAFTPTITASQLNIALVAIAAIAFGIGYTHHSRRRTVIERTRTEGKSRGVSFTTLRRGPRNPFSINVDGWNARSHEFISST